MDREPVRATCELPVAGVRPLALDLPGALLFGDVFGVEPSRLREPLQLGYLGHPQKSVPRCGPNRAVLSVIGVPHKGQRNSALIGLLGRPA